MRQTHNKTEEKIESELLFLIKFIFYSIQGILSLPLAIFFPKLREIVKKPLVVLKKFLTGAKITTTLILINLIVFFLVQPFFRNYISQIINLNFKISGILFIDFFLNIIFVGFMHGSIAHLFGNMFALFIFGRIIEKYLKEKYLLIYFGAHVVGVLLHVFLRGPGLGASAAISGLVMSAILIKPFYISFAAIIPVPVFILGWLSIAKDFISEFNGASNGVGHLAHIGGYIGAFFVSLFFVGIEKKKEILKGLIINIIMLIIIGIIFLIRK